MQKPYPRIEAEISEKKKIDAQLIRADRLASLGQLSSGIVHEIRNPLTGIRLFLDLLSDPERFERTEQEKEIFSDMLANVDRIAGIIQRVLDFSKTTIGRKCNVDLNRLVTETISFCETQMVKTNITLKLNLARNLFKILGDPVQIQQVLNNLILNAIEAMGSGGLLTISTDVCRSGFGDNGQSVRLTVADNGPGVDAGNVDHIFHPFYTTKPAGTGLGLAISHNIIETHGGSITVASDKGKGAVFTIEFPVCPGAPRC